MATILIVSTGRTSLRNRCVELMRRLEAAGHQTTFAGPEGIRDSLQPNGVRFEALDVNPQPPAPESPSGRSGPLGKVGPRP